MTEPPGVRVIWATTRTPPDSADVSRKVIVSPVTVLVTVRFVTLMLPVAVIATSLVGGVVCGSLIGWFLRSIKCSGRGWLLGSSSTMLRSQPAAIANKAAVGWLRRAGSDLVGAEA